MKAVVHCPLSALSLRAVKAAAGALVSGPHVFCTCYSVAEPGTPANCVNLGCALRWAEPGEAKASSLRTSVSRKKSQESPLPCIPQGGPWSSEIICANCFGVGCEWQRAPKKSDLKEKNTDFLINSLEADSPGLEMWLLDRRDLGSLCLLVPPFSLVQNGCSLSSHHVHIPARGKEEVAKNVALLFKDLLPEIAHGILLPLGQNGDPWPLLNFRGQVVWSLFGCLYAQLQVMGMGNHQQCQPYLPGSQSQCFETQT